LKIIVTGCAGFVGSSLVDRLLHVGHQVIGIDNFSTGNRHFLTDANENNNFTLVEGDLLNDALARTVISGVDIVYHMSANADVRHGPSHTKKDLEQNTIVTYNVLEAMRRNKVKNIVFASTGSVYGDNPSIPTSERGPFPVQTSLYGASKLACEGLISAFCEAFDIRSWIFRFVSLLGDRYTHGHVYDFFKQLSKDPNVLHVLGDGTQKKSYLHITDCIDAIFIAVEKANSRVNIFNLGTNEYCTVRDSIGWISEELNVNPELKYSGGSRGWIGDNPFIFLDTKQIRSLGWKASYSISESVICTVRYLRDNPWLFRERRE